MRLSPTSDLWWKNAVIYCLDVETFRDADGDGCGDLAGLIERIDHVAELGATCVWLMPLYPTPNQDDGYDITDYLGVDPRLGDLGDVVEAIRHANDRGLRVLADLVVNHTSIEHPWFQAARASRDVALPRLLRVDRRPGERARHDRGQLDLGRAGGPVLPAPLPAVPARPQHRQPRGPRRRSPRPSASGSTLGVSGFRMDAVPFMRRGGRRRPAATRATARRWLHALREYAGRRRGEVMLMGEVNVAMDDLASYFEDHGDALHLQLGFLINQRLWLSLARGEAAPLEDLIRRLPVPAARLPAGRRSCATTTS